MHRCGRIRFEFRRAVTKPGTREGTGYVPEVATRPQSFGFSLEWLPRSGAGEKYISPSTGCFLASPVSGDKAVAAARQSKFAPGTLKVIDEAKRYPEGTAVRIEVHGAEDIAGLKVLAKMLKVLAKI